jgi:N-acetylglucosaminyl-diphospho-decaprenol L-rhamnosyltransferase
VPVDVSIVIVTYNSEPVIGGLLDSIPAGLDGLLADVVVVDNGSADGTVSAVSSRTDCRVIASTNTGFAGGINRGVAASPEGTGGDLVVVLNADVRLAPGSIRRLAAAFDDERVGVAAPQVRSPDGALHHSLRREPTLRRAMGLTDTGIPAFSDTLNDDSDYVGGRDVDWALGAALAISRACFDALNGWDESFFLYSEETDFCLRARDLGYLTRYVPDAVVTHIGGQSGRNAKTHTMQVVNRVRFYRRRHGVAPSAVFLLLTALREVVGIRRGGATRAEHKAALTALFRPSRRPAELGSSTGLIPR